MSVEAARVLQPESEAGAVLAELFERHGRMVLGICRAILSDPYDAEDAAQQAFLSAHDALLRGTRPRRPDAWLAAIARNECRARIARRLSRPTPLPLLDDAVEAPDAEPGDRAAWNAEVDALAAGVSTLPERQREAVLLRDFFGLSYREVAAAMSISEPAVESLLSRARRRLEECVGPLHVAQGALVVPPSLRDELARLVPGFSATEAVSVGGAAISGLLAKLAATPVAGKVAAGVTVGALVVGADGSIERTTAEDSTRPTARVAPAGPATTSAAPEGLRPVAVSRTVAHEIDGDSGGPSPRSGARPGSESSGPGSLGAGSGDGGLDNSGPGSLSSGSGGSELDNSGPGSLSSGSGESEVDNSGPGSFSSGSGESELDNSGPGSLSSGSGSGTSSSDSGSDSGSGSSGSDSGSGSSGSDD